MYVERFTTVFEDKVPIIIIIIINFSISEVHVIQKKVNWTHKQPIIVTQKPEKSRRTTETAVGKKRKRTKEAE